MIERLETERLVLRRPAGADWPAARDFFTSDRAKGVGGPLDLGRAWRALAGEIGHWEIRGYGMFTVTRKGAEDVALGMIGPWYPGDWPETEVGWMIWDPSVEGTGIATEAARACLSHAWRVLGWETVVSYVAPDNLRSRRLAEKLGAAVDPDAPVPYADKPTVVYRHKRPEGLP